MIEIMISYALMLYLGLAHVANQSSMKIHSPAHVEILGGAWGHVANKFNDRDYDIIFSSTLV